MYEDNKNKAKELKERFKEDYDSFKDSREVKKLYTTYEKSI